jgi:hypothetical protein
MISLFDHITYTPMTSEFKQGDEVVVISDPSVVYTIVSIYAEVHAICSYKDRETRLKKELSIPLVALTKLRSIECDCV